MVCSDRVDDDGGRFNGRIVLKFLPLNGRIMALLNAGESIERTPVWCSDNLIKDVWNLVRPHLLSERKFLLGSWNCGLGTLGKETGRRSHPSRVIFIEENEKLLTSKFC